MDNAMTVREVSELTGVSIRTLQYYDQIGLLKPTKRTAAGYRLYDEAALETLQQILLFRELEFPLEEIRRIMHAPGFDREKALGQHIALLTLKRERLDRLIALAEGIQKTGESMMDFKAFDKSKQEAYAREAKAQWGDTGAYAEYEKKSTSRSAQAEHALGQGMMQLFEQFGKLRGEAPAGEAAQALVKALQSYITDNFYTCTDEILASLGMMYATGGAFTKNIDAAGGEGTAQFAADAIAAYCAR